MTINVNDVDEFDVGHDRPTATPTINAVDENAANGHRRWGDRTGQRRRCDQQHDHLHAGRQRRRTIHDRSDRPVSSPSTTARCSIAKRRPATTSRCEPARSDGSFDTAVMTINVNDVDEFDVGHDRPTATSPPTPSTKTRPTDTVVGVTALAATPTRPTTRSPTRWTTTLADDSRSIGSTGVVTVADGTLLDREAAASHNITVRATQQRRQFRHRRDDDQRQRRR